MTNSRVRYLREELGFRLSLRILVAVSLICLLSIGLHLVWAIYQHDVLVDRIRQGFAHTIQTDIERSDLVNLRKTMRAFEITNRGSKICLRLDDNLEVADSKCAAHYQEFQVPLTEIKYYVAVEMPIHSQMVFGGLIFLGVAICLAFYVLRLFRRLANELVSDVELLEKAVANEPSHFHFLELCEASSRIEAGLRAQISMDQTRRELELGRLVTQVAHDIRSPVSALQMAVAGSQIESDRQQVIKGAIARIQAITNKMLESMRPTYGQKTNASTNQTSRVDRLVDEIVAEKKFQYSSRPEISIEVDTRGGDEAVIRLDRETLGRILSNLINNSIEAIEGAGQVQVVLRKYTTETSLTVIDTGRGIPENVLPTIGQRGTTSKKNGNGLGIFFAKETVESVGGRLRIQSKLGRGTLISLSFPNASPTLIA